MIRRTDARELTIDKEFEALCRPLKVHELADLEAGIIEAGKARDPIIVWANHDDTILDGHNRYRICKENDLPFKTESLTFADRDECLIWIAKHQLGRRNLSEEEASYLRGKKYEAVKKKHGGDRKSEKSSGNDCHLKSETAKTAEKMAKEDGVSERTIRNDAAFAKAVDTLAENVGGDAREAALTKKVSRKEAVAIAALPKEEQAEAVKEATAKEPGKKPSASRKVTSYWDDARELLDKVGPILDKTLGICEQASAYNMVGGSQQYRSVKEQHKNAQDAVKRLARCIDSLERKAQNK